MISLFGKPAALQEEQQRLVPSRLSHFENLGDSRPDVGPDFLPYLVGASAEHPIALDADSRQVRIIAEEGEFRPPKHPHRITRIEHHSNDGLQGLRPLFGIAQRRDRPVERAHSGAHLPAPLQKP